VASFPQLGINVEILQPACPSSPPKNSVKALKELESTNPGEHHLLATFICNFFIYLVTVEIKGIASLQYWCWRARIKGAPETLVLHGLILYEKQTLQCLLLNELMVTAVD